MPCKTLIGLAAGACALALAAFPAHPVVAWADPETAPVAPNVNAYPPIAPADYTAMSGAWYAFGTPDGLTCIIDRGRGIYGCSGALPGAPSGANLVTGGPAGGAAFAVADGSPFAVAGPVKPLPPKTRLSYKTVSCANDGAGMTACVNSYDQTGFVIGPAGSFILGETPPLLDRPKDQRP